MHEFYLVWIGILLGLFDNGLMTVHFTALQVRLMLIHFEKIGEFLWAKDYFNECFYKNTLNLKFKDGRFVVEQLLDIVKMTLDEETWRKYVATENTKHQSSCYTE